MTEIVNVGRDAASMVEAPKQPAYTGVKIYVGKDSSGADLYYSAGTDTGTVLEIENPWGTQAIANNILTAISGYSYKPMQADSTLIDPAAEMGDAITVNKAYSVLARRDTTFGALIISDIAAPSDGELGHEYPYESHQDRQTQREIEQANSSLIVELDEIKGQVTDDDGNYTVLTLRSDGLYIDGSKTTLDGSNLTNGSVSGTKITANSIDTGQIKANAIHADQIKAGEITSSKLAADCVTAEKIDSGAVTTDSLLITGMVSFYDSKKKNNYASLGYGTGMDGNSNTPTYGAKLQSGSNYVIVTNAGARMTAGSGQIYTVSSGACWCSQAFQTTSDERIKTDIDDDMSVYKDVLMNLRPVSFRYKPEWSSNQARQTGFIAQEAESAVEDCEAGDWGLTSISGDGLHGINYEALIPVLVSCVQEQAREIAELKERING